MGKELEGDQGSKAYRVKRKWTRWELARQSSAAMPIGFSLPSNSKSRGSVEEGDGGESQGSKGSSREAVRRLSCPGVRRQTDWPGTGLEAHSGSSLEAGLSRLALGLGVG